MSLFKTSEFWCTNFEYNEDFDQNCFKISKLNGDDDFILVGSHLGILRVLKPTATINDNNFIEGYKVNDLCIEKQLNFPILQIDVGKLVSGSPLVQIAILHPRSFCIYSFTQKDGLTEQGNQNMINLLYEHKLRRSGANFVLGPFGGSQNRDFIVVQSLDGMLSFFEQETFVFCCFLPNFLLPQPFIYCLRTDCFIFCGSNLNVESYSYKTLSSIGQDTSETDISGLKFEPDWVLNLSENITDIQYVHDHLLKQSFIMILTERNILCLSDSGQIKFMKRLDFTPYCFYSYYLSENKLFSMIVSESSTLLIYQNTTLRWSAQLSILPVAMGRANFKFMKGVIVALSEDGQLQCSYLGTHPSMFSAPPLQNQELNYDETEKELATLTRQIQSINDIKGNDKTEDDILVTIDVNPNLEECVYAHHLEDIQSIKMCALRVNVTSSSLLDEAVINVFVHEPLKVLPNSQIYHSFKQTTSFDCYVFMCHDAEIISLEAVVTVSYINTIGVPRIVTMKKVLPMLIAFKEYPPLKESEFKVTLTVNENLVPLSTLFPDFLDDNLVSNNNVLCLKSASNKSNPTVIMVAKSSQRYRLQSNSISALNICVKELKRRLQQHYKSNSNFKVACCSALPITAAFQSIKEHFICRQKVLKLQNDIIQLGSQFRLIQKRLISKFKDKNPTPLENLDMLLSETNNEILDVSTNFEKAQDELLLSQINLTAALNCLVELIKLSEEKQSEDILENVLAPEFSDIDGQNWEDVLDASLNYLLKTKLAKSEKDKLRAAIISYEDVKDLSKLDKHFSLVLERCLKGNIIEAKEEDDEINDLSEEPEKQDEEKVLEEKDVVPIGSRLGEASTRLLSARRSLLNRRRHIKDDQ